VDLTAAETSAEVAAEAPRTPVAPRARVVVLVSGAGSNMVALGDAAARGEVAADIVAVISDVSDAPALQRATERGIPAVAIPFDRRDRPAWEARLADAVAEHDADLVVLAGFMRILSGAFLARWPDRVVNVHPSLLPAFRGADAVGDALAAGVDETGVSVHLVDELVDHGPILAQESVPVLPGDTRTTLLSRLHEVEHRLLPRCVDELARTLHPPTPAPHAPADRSTT
jgi:phosphoribosylglycinamide formyltransferase 1